MEIRKEKHEFLLNKRFIGTEIPTRHADESGKIETQTFKCYARFVREAASLIAVKMMVAPSIGRPH